MANREAMKLQDTFPKVPTVSSLADLPPPTTTRWVARLKAQVVCGINLGLLSVRDACRTYNLTIEELGSWQRAIDRDGLPGLRATHAQHYRRLHEQHRRTVQHHRPATTALGAAG